VEGLPDQAKPVLNLQLSSPIEEATLGQVFDPLNSDPPPEGSLAVFKGVETSVATLTVTVMDADIPLGFSLSHDIAPLCALDAMDIKDKYVTDIPVSIIAEEGYENPVAAVAAATKEEDKPKEEEATEVQKVADDDDKEVPVEVAEVVEVSEQDTKTDDELEKTGSATAVPVPVVVLPTCTVTLRITYRPSPKDQREELYELLNKTSQRKAMALENLRDISMASSQASNNNNSPTESSTAVTRSSNAIKPGFLNKNKKKEPTRMQKLYERTFGPQSLLMMGAGVAVFAKNYIIFFGAVSFFHFQGQMLALPPPV
jgi:hypothetical protein